MIRRRFAIVLLALGTIAGYGSALCSWSHARHVRREAFEQHLARVCLDAAHRGAPAR